MGNQFEEEKRNVPDMFNDHFSSLGWIAYEGMNFDLMKQAIVMAENGELGEAELLLVEHYNEKMIRQNLTRMHFIPEFRPREHLLQKALNDYVSERYYACIPIVLSSIDGFVNDIIPTGFFAKDSDLTVWDSIAPHSTGLQTLSKIFSEPRTKTTTKEITIPYRHGILHGRDLKYGNKIVAAKTWAALFALRDWVVALRKPPLPPSSQPLTFHETLLKLEEIQEEKERWDVWKPRELEIGVDIPLTGQPENFSESLPERALAEFMLLWEQHNYGKMSMLLFSLHHQDSVKKTAGWVRSIFEDTSLRNFEIISIEDFSPEVSIVNTNITFDDNSDVLRSKVFSIRLIHEDKVGKRVAVGNPNGNWHVMVTPFINGFDV